MNSVEIFLTESFALNRFATAGYLAFFVLVCVFDGLLQTTTKSMASIALLNAVYTVFLCQVLTVSEFIMTWKSGWLGGEAPAAAIVFVVSLCVLFYAKKLSLSHAGVEFTRPNLVCLAPLLIPYTPALLLLAYIFALGSSWKN